MPPCSDCGKPVYSWVGRPDATNARCFDCWDRLDDAKYARAERRFRVFLWTALATIVGMLLYAGFANGW